MTLTTTLSGMIAASGQAGGKQKIRLPRGLIVTVEVNRQNDTTALSIARENGQPSQAEWTTVCKAWPYPIGRPTPIKG